MDYNFKVTEFKRAAAENGDPSEGRDGARAPDMKGAYTVEGRNQTPVSLWIEQAKETGKPYITGKLGAASLVDKIVAQRGATSAASDVPPNIDIALGELRLFRNDKATSDNKQPQWRGYAREQDGGYTEIAAWDRFDGLEGSAKPYRPYERSAEAAIPSPNGPK
jgi:hypothetical protein